MHGLEFICSQSNTASAARIAYRESVLVSTDAGTVILHYSDDRFSPYERFAY